MVGGGKMKKLVVFLVVVVWPVFGLENIVFAVEAKDPANPQIIYSGLNKGLLKSEDGGRNWRKVFRGKNYLENECTAILVLPGRILLGTKAGLFISDNNGSLWEKIFIAYSLGSSVDNEAEEPPEEEEDSPVEIKYLRVDPDNPDYIYLALGKKVYKSRDKGRNWELEVSSSDKNVDITAVYYANEPRIEDVQAAAIKYAEVSPEKIQDWRRRAKMKAVLPKLTVGIDRSQSTNYEIYTSATTRYVYDGPPDESHGWDLTLSWDLGELVWNLDQTSIDVRSRLMVELRDNILDEVTKLYFQRLRVKMELDNLSIEDRKKRLEKELQLKELSASIDALTGGYFSKTCGS